MSQNETAYYTGIDTFAAYFFTYKLRLSQKEQS